MNILISKMKKETRKEVKKFLQVIQIASEGQGFRSSCLIPDSTP